MSEVILHDYYVLYQIVLDSICLYSGHRYAAAGSSRGEDKFVVVPIEATTFAMSQCGKKREEREEATKGKAVTEVKQHINSYRVVLVVALFVSLSSIHSPSTKINAIHGTVAIVYSSICNP